MSLPEKASNFLIVYLQYLQLSTPLLFATIVVVLLFGGRDFLVYISYFSTIILFISNKCSFYIGISSCFMNALSYLFGDILKICFKFSSSLCIVSVYSSIFYFIFPFLL